MSDHRSLITDQVNVTRALFKHVRFVNELMQHKEPLLLVENEIVESTLHFVYLYLVASSHLALLSNFKQCSFLLFSSRSRDREGRED